MSVTCIKFARAFVLSFVNSDLEQQLPIMHDESQRTSHDGHAPTFDDTHCACAGNEKSFSIMLIQSDTRRQYGNIYDVINFIPSNPAPSILGPCFLPLIKLHSLWWVAGAERRSASHRVHWWLFQSGQSAVFLSPTLLFLSSLYPVILANSLCFPLGRRAVCRLSSAHAHVPPTR